MIDKFPVWNLKPYSAMMMRHMACPEREKVLILQRIRTLMIARKSLDLRKGHVIVWVVVLFLMVPHTIKQIQMNRGYICSWSFSRQMEGQAHRVIDWK